MGHWYDTSGNPMYTIVGKNGKERDTTLRDAKKLNLVPSVNGIMQILSKPGLDIWKRDKLLEVIWDFLPTSLLLKDYHIFKSEVNSLYKKTMDEIPQKGTDIHNELEKFLNLMPVDEKYFDLCEEVYEGVYDIIGKFDYIAEKPFYNPLGFGGRIDLCCIDQEIIIDFKTKLKYLHKPQITLDHAIQLSAYSASLFESPKDCYIVFISPKNDLSEKDEWDINICKISQGDLEKGWNIFKNLLKVWKTINLGEIL